MSCKINNLVLFSVFTKICAFLAFCVAMACDHVGGAVISSWINHNLTGDCTTVGFHPNLRCVLWSDAPIGALWRTLPPLENLFRTPWEPHKQTRMGFLSQECFECVYHIVLIELTIMVFPLWPAKVYTSLLPVLYFNFLFLFFAPEGLCRIDEGSASS